MVVGVLLLAEFFLQQNFLICRTFIVSKLSQIGEHHKPNYFDSTSNIAAIMIIGFTKNEFSYTLDNVLNLKDLPLLILPSFLFHPRPLSYSIRPSVLKYRKAK